MTIDMPSIIILFPGITEVNETKDWLFILPKISLRF